MSLLQAGVDTSAIALWLGHAGIRSTDAYIDADISVKEKALASPALARHGRYHPSDKVLAFLESLQLCRYQNAPQGEETHHHRAAESRLSTSLTLSQRRHISTISGP